MSKRKVGTGESAVTRINTSIKVDEARWRKFGAEMKLRGDTVSEGLEYLIDSFLVGRMEIPDGTKADAPAKLVPGHFHERNMRLHDLLERVLESGNQGAIGALIENLKFFAHAAHLIGPKTIEQVDEDLELMLPEYKTKPPEP